MNFLGNIIGGAKVYDRPNSHIHNGVRCWIPKALSKIDCSKSPDNISVHTITFCRKIGFDFRSEIEDGNRVVWAKRIRSDGSMTWSKFITNKPAELTQNLTLVLERIDTGYLLLTAFAGDKAEKEPNDPSLKGDAEISTSINFWKKHALLMTGHEVELSTQQFNPPEGEKWD